MQILAHIGLFRMYQIIKLFTLIVLVLNISQKKLVYSLDKTNIKTYIFRIQADNSIMCGYFCTGFIDYICSQVKL